MCKGLTWHLVCAQVYVFMLWTFYYFNFRVTSLSIATLESYLPATPFTLVKLLRFIFFSLNLMSLMYASLMQHDK